MALAALNSHSTTKPSPSNFKDWACGSSCQVCSTELAISGKLLCLDIVSHRLYAQIEKFLGGNHPMV
ncbi:hypothetical protein EUGRSUZ_H02137 [Eucalyptus grandis]|uniref:Uncharacterized protein n=2 Tax=Eucalyptus grandis TaxID=71139 RepID=A0ACC3JS68_EUCGR|nr:hypothetical protein EUGRSUZ_H02137 [Eucalyptus grandis]